MSEYAEYTRADLTAGGLAVTHLQHPMFTATIADVERATGVAVRPGLVVEGRGRPGARTWTFEVRVLGGDDAVLVDWTTVPAAYALG